MQTFEVIEGGSPDWFVFCDHASNAMPYELEGLGLPKAELERHIAHDIGAAGVARELCGRLGCAGLLAGVSRLVIDLNRDPDHPGLVPVESDGTAIPGNAGLGAGDVAGRRRLFYDPYHAKLAEMLDARPGAFAISVHSFTPHPRTGSRRALDLGLLAKEDADGGDMESAQAFLAALNPDLVTAVNAPYSAYDLNHTVDAHVIPRGLRHLGIEVRQDHIGTEAGQRVFAKWIHAALTTL